jgi:UDP-2-acetamido-3-amino-2,3-dideoxy-glucuronate N-acetyltransferase
MAQTSLKNKSQYSDVRIHPTATIEVGVSIGPNSSIWDSVHIRSNAVLGHHCIVGEKSYIAYDVRVGNYVKINAFVYIPTGVTVEDKVMISAGCIFVNDNYPRAFDFTKGGLLSSSPNEETLETVIREGATIGAAVTVLGGLEIGRFSLVGAGSVVTKNVPDHALMVGNPARRIGWVCVCGKKLNFKKAASVCVSCKRKFKIKAGAVLSA